MLVAHEIELLVALLQRVEWPLNPKIFRAFVNIVVSVPIELAVLNERDEILMFYRKDEEYDGNHIPGTVLRDNETVSDAIARLRKSEVVGGNISDPIDIGHIEIVKGNGFGENPTRHEISLVHVSRLMGPYTGSGKFYLLDRLPEDTLPHHQKLVSKVIEYLQTLN
ncbi:MAG: hypothetical protein AAB432_00590 [Patescibacteria group bacterium]